MVQHRRISKLIVALVIVSSIMADVSAECNQTCGENRNSVPYPFGFSHGCQIRLDCSQNGGVMIGNYKVQNITSESIFINFPTQCNRKFNEIGLLFGQNFAPTWQNSLVLQNCTEPLSGCMLPEKWVESEYGLQISCGVTTEKIRCFSKVKKGLEFIDQESLNGAHCENVLASFAVDMVNDSGNNPASSLRFQAAELGWWLKKPRNCSPDAVPTNLSVPSGGFGFRCRCKEGFVGDGFADGDGCQRVSKCHASGYLSGHCGGRNKVGVLVGGVIAGAVLMAALVLICYFIRRRSSSSKEKISAKRILSEAAGRSSVPFFSYKEIERATSGFSDKLRLGTGAYGTVYAGKLHNDEWVAIKKIRHQDTDGVEQVMNEIKLLSSVSHPNLVRLLGCCIENNEQILLYEFMPNGTLCQHLQRERGSVLPWTVRLSIATETAHAIAYLHSAMNPPIYHRDIKSSNILLDYNFNSKVADFGLSRLGMTDDSHISTAPQGTPGYVDPQYHQNYHLSDKSDVYSFGVVLVEIITALKVVDFSRTHNEVNLAALAIEKIGKGHMDEIVDQYVEPNRDAWTLSSIYKVAELAFRCLAFHRDMRPSMNEVADELEQIRLSGWAPLEENICMASSVTSTCSSPLNASERSTGSVSVKKVGVGSRRSVVSLRVAESLASLQEVKDFSPVSVEYWQSEQSSPSTNSLLGNVVR